MIRDGFEYRLKEIADINLLIAWQHLARGAEDILCSI